MKTFSELKPGDTAEFEAVLDERVHEAFAEIVGDHSPVHSDPEFARALKFEGRIGYGFLLCGLLSRLYGEYLPGGSSICIRQDARFIRPYYPGDTIKVLGRITGKIESTKMVEITSEMFRNGGDSIFKGVGTVQITHEDEPALYESDGVVIRAGDFVRALSSLGLTEGDVVFVHSDVSVFGRLKAENRPTLMEQLSAALKACVGAGSIIMPAFSYSFCKGEVFDPAQTKSTVGALTEYFRRETDVVRSLHPIFSVTVSGKDKEWFAAVGSDSFSPDSIFGKLHQRHGKLLFLGAPFQSCTYLHYVEQQYGVPYRYIKEFGGIVRTSSGDRQETCTYFVRHLDREANFNTTKLEKRLLDQKLAREAHVGEGRLLLIGSDVLFEEASKLLEEDINGLLEAPPR